MSNYPTDVLRFSMPALLSLDTSTDACSLACVLGEYAAERHELLPRAHNRHILAMVDQVMAGQPLSALEAIVCGVGPGSFTGLRVATGVAQGLAWSLNVPVLPFCSLMSQALAAPTELDDSDGYVLSTIEAQTGQFYWRLFDGRDGGLQPVGEPCLGVFERLLDQLGDCASHRVRVVGSAAKSLVDRLGAGLSIEWAVHAEVRPRAAAALQFVCEHPNPPLGISAENLQPLYVQTDIGWKKLSEQPKRA
ncbi:MAG: tRNA (adenosine(37)-N6)-threonylcarbamoyltransferase complex dimerization subunit type 1 TsaB [Luminiphilus sp.]|jgi:tRNA threonylcarbamoyladenosine biosynthesis protein TsaB|nr:tRNA (adenosine(37)-N6)-threonylcarbamoyltransferase complex dimerization subunit type 1 TsaB [Luminiphilus sp.]MDG1460834.1 tRNA (adenosine(37)-N6)-threonylcarbamoyltransferase complex dimerization subunit type 1 TsaB [Luminiphilus sp.]